MYQAAVIYAPASPEMEALSAVIDGRLREHRIKVVRKEAAQAIIPDLAAADLVLLGSTAAGKAAIHGDFAEILRALKGISLAGRVVGVFALRSDSTLKAFQKALEDCEIPLDERQFLSVEAPENAPQDLGPWVGGLIAELEARAGAR